MRALSYQTLRDQGYDGFLTEHAPERVLQFGEGGFLRAFADYFIDIMNEKAGFNTKVVIVQPIAQGFAKGLGEQDCLYTVCLRGLREGEPYRENRVISCVSRCVNPYEDYRAFLDCARNPELRFILSNTTEAGIVFDPSCGFDDAPPAAFPAKLTRFLYERYTLGLRGFVLLSCELIDDNGAELRRCVERYCDLWKLPPAFAAWVARENLFCATLVDRIVTGYPRAEAETLHAENGYSDALLTAAEPFGLWVIEGPEALRDELPAEACGLPILITDDLKPYKQRKVRLLNGAHTALVPGAFLMGKDIVRDCMSDPTLRGFFDKLIQDEIIPTLTLPKQELRDFAAAVADRFENPFIDHELLSIALNSAAKWRARLAPSLSEYYRSFGRLPPCITASLAAFIAFYGKGYKLEDGVLYGLRAEKEYPIRDDLWVLAFFRAHCEDSPTELAHAVVGNERMWGDSFACIPGLAEAVAVHLTVMERDGMRAALERAWQSL